MNKFERDIQNNIEVNEGFFTRLASAFATRKMKGAYGPAMKKVFNAAKHDPELQAAIFDLEDYQERLQRILKSMCKRRPNHPKCK